MWCYQKPGFEALLLTELQRQQQCSQFCDTLLKTDGVSVPAHSCILSAISPNISSALSSMPPPPAGQSRLLEFRALGACTLLHMVRLLYSGEMAGEGEEEKHQAISAAAKLGISGLVEVTRRDRESRHEEEGGGRHTEAAVQTEPMMPEEDEGRRSRWRRQVRDGSTFLWKETLSEGEKDTWTQTEELQVNAAPPSHPAASYETIDLTALQSLGRTEPHLLPPQIPYVPVSLVYPLGENQTHQPSSAPVHSMQESTAAGHTSVPVVAPPYTSAPPSLLPFSNQATPCAADPQSWWAGSHSAARDVVAAEELEDERFEQFQGNIPGYINYFLNPDRGEHSRGGRARRRQGAGVGGARRARTGERRARRPQARTGGRGRGGLTQTVDVQEVGVSRLQKLFLQRWGMRVPRTGQGGGAAGRRLYLKTRELLKPAKSCQRRRGRGKVWEFSPSGEVLPYSDGGARNTQLGRRNTMQQFHQDDLRVGRAQIAKASPTASLSFSSPPVRLYNVHYLSAPDPPPAPPPHEEQPEHFDRLLEEVMMGLDILPNNNNGAPQSQPPVRASSSSCTYASSGQTLSLNKQQQGRHTGLLEAGPTFRGPTQVVTVAKGAAGSSSANSEVPVLQQQGDGELNEMLEHFLLTFEQHVNSCSAREEVVMGGQSCTEAPDRSSQITEQQRNDEAETPARRSQPCRASSVRSAVPSKHTAGKDRTSAKRRKKRIKNQYLFSLERKRVRVRKPAPSSDAKAKIVKDRGDKQLKLMPVVKLERRGPLPVRVTLQSLGVKCPEKNKKQKQTSSSSVKSPHDRSSDKNQPAFRSTKTYPIRSRLREAHMDSMLILEPPLVHKRSQGRPRKNGQLLSSANSEHSISPIQPQPVEACATEEQLQKNQERGEEELTVQPQEEAEGPARRGKRRGAESEEETSDDATVAKRVCFEQIPQPTAETCTLSSESADVEPAAVEIEDVIDVETISLASVGDCPEREEREEKPALREIDLRETEESSMNEEVESSTDEIIDVDGDVEDDCQTEAEEDRCQLHFAQNPPHSEVNLRSTGGWEEDKDEDIDVIGGSSPVPDPVVISWTESSEGEKEEGDEDVDIFEEMTDYASSAIYATVGKGELVNRKYQTEVLLH